MNDKAEQIDNPTKDSNSDVERPRDPLNFDTLVQSLSWMANVYGLSIPLTLQVGGALVSGRLISKEIYDQGMNPLMRNVVGSGADEETKETFAILADSLFPPPQEASPNSDSLSASEINYVHLANAMIYYPNGSVPSKGGGVYWRGRLSAVDGFFFGEIQIEKSS